MLAPAAGPDTCVRCVGGLLVRTAPTAGGGWAVHTEPCTHERRVDVGGPDEDFERAHRLELQVANLTALVFALAEGVDLSRPNVVVSSGCLAALVAAAREVES